MEESQRHADRLAAILQRYSDQEVGDFLPLLLVALCPWQSKAELEELSPLLGWLAVKLQVDPKSPPGTLEKKMAEFYAKHPPNPALVAEFREFAQQELAGAIGSAAEEAVMTKIVEAASHHAQVPRGLEPPRAVGVHPLGSPQSRGSLGIRARDPLKKRLNNLRGNLA